MAIITFIDLDPADRAIFEDSLGSHTLHFADTAQQIPPETEVLIPFVNFKVDASLLDRLAKLRLIACRSTGYDNVDLAAAKARNICVTNVPAYGSTAVSEYTMLLILALTRKLQATLQETAQPSANRLNERGLDLAGKTLGIIGTGNIGRSVARMAKAFAMRVIAFDIFPNHNAATEIGFEYVSLKTVLSSADIVSLHAPSTAETRHMINAKSLALMQPRAVLINTARGDLIHTADLVAALQDNRLWGAGLDVLENENQLHEPHSSVAQSLEELQKHPNVLVTNHNAFNSNEAVEVIYTTTCKNILAFLQGQPKNVVS